jgi:hypothetical protein
VCSAQARRLQRRGGRSARCLQKMRQRRKCRHADEGLGEQHARPRTRRAVEHPRRKLLPPSPIGAVQRATEINAIRLRSRRMDMNGQAKPRMPPIENFADTGPVGVLNPCCTTRAALIRRSATPLRRPMPPHSPQRAIGCAPPTRSADHPLLRRRTRATMTVGLWLQLDERRGSEQRHSKARHAVARL